MEPNTPWTPEAVLSQYGGMMAYIVRGILPDPQEQEECLAELRARLVEILPRYQAEKAAMSTWLTAVCRNAAYDRRRALEQREQRSAPLDERLPDPAPGPEEQVLRQERANALKAALNTLGHRDRQLFYRKYYYLQSTAQIAAELGSTQRAIEGRLYRIRKKLQQHLGGDGR